MYNREDIRILIIDDDQLQLKLTERLLKTLGFKTVLKASSASEAMRLTKEQPPDLFLIDVVMPKMGGGEFRELLRADPATRDIPVIFISGIISKEEEEQMGGRLKSGDPIVAKPFSKQRITKAIAESLKMEIAYSS